MFSSEQGHRKLDIIKNYAAFFIMNNPAASSGVSKRTRAPRGGELGPHLSRSAYSDL